MANIVQQTLSAQSVFGRTAGLRSTRTARPVARNVALNVTAREGAWCPGSVAPDHLDGSLPGDFGFDPLNLGADPVLLAKFREAEVMHCRWTMLAAVGMLAVEGGGYATSWIEAPTWALDGSHATYFGVDLGPTQLLYCAVSQAVLMGLVEQYRNAESDPEKRVYPGGSFDPLGLSAGDLDDLKTKEIKHGRLAMISVFGYFMQGAVTHEGPIAAWQAHVDNPWSYNVATSNDIAIPILHPGVFSTGSDFWSAAVPSWYPVAQ